MSENDLDALIIGAGISGVGAACHLAQECPQTRFAILDSREDVGGTWDLFRFPGVRADTDIFAFAYQFQPWSSSQKLPPGRSIKDYIKNTAKDFGVHERIHLGLKVTRADWWSADQRWTVTATEAASGQTRQFHTKFLIMGTGYFNHDVGFTPELPGIGDFEGQIVHPQHWPEQLDYTGKKVVVIGSGATAVTLIPAMANKTAHITMLQRSPSYIFSVPPVDKVFALLKRFLPEDWAYGVTRWCNIHFYQLLWSVSKRWPRFVRWLMLRGVRKQVGESQMRHFTPDYNPWDERLCAIPGNDLFKAINADRASVVTDHIEHFDTTGIQLQSGEHLDADIIITATGLNLQVLGGAELHVDSQPRQISELMMYKAVLAESLPNFATIFGYVNYPWTMKVDIASAYICRLIKHMDEQGYAVAVPEAGQAGRCQDTSIMDSLESGYIRRSGHHLQRQGKELPWRVLHDYNHDKKMLLQDPIDDGVLQFQRPGETVACAEERQHRSAA